MPILPSDIKLLESERMSDSTDGGGRMTSREIISGQLSNIFPKISRTDAVYGRVNLRKVYAAVRSATLDMYGGAHAIIADAPDDPKIGAVLFSTASAFDQRTDARNRIESYVVAGGLSRLRLYGNQIIGSAAVVVYQRSEEPLPEAGNVMCLSVEAAGYTPVQQYVRITDFSHETRTFTDSTGDYQRRIITLKLSSTLAQTYVGAEMSRLAADAAPTKIRDTLVADASKYYGIQPVSGALAAGAFGASVASVYGQIVPSATRETAVSMAEIAGAGALLQTSAGTVSEVLSGIVMIATTIGVTASLSRGVMPGTLTLRVSSHVGTDDGAGNLTGGIIGSIDYESGNISNLRSVAFSGGGAPTATYTPAVPLGQPAHTRNIPITLATRGTVYAESLMPLPAKSTLIIDYRALGKWYRLRDNGNGVLAGNGGGVGAGTVNYNTGAVVVTLGALPDVDSAVLLSWGSPAHTVIRAGVTADAGATIQQTIQLADKPVLTDSVSVKYRVNGVERTLTDNAFGIISGTGATGKVDYASGVVTLEYSDRLPDFGSTVTVDYSMLVASGGGGSAALVRSHQTACTADRKFLLGTAADFAAISPGSLRGTITLGSPDVPDVVLEFKDNGSGSLQTAAAYNTGQVGVPAGLIIGLVNYNTGEVTATATLGISFMKWLPPGGYIGGTAIGGYWQQAASTATAKIGAIGSFVYQTTAASISQVTSQAVVVDAAAASAGPAVALCRTTSQTVVPGSVVFTAAGRVYWDENGTLYSRLNTTSLDKIASGSIDYGSGLARLTLWNGNTVLGLTVNACLTAYGSFTAVSTEFRTAGSPLRPASFYLQVTAKDGAMLSATCDQNGIITSEWITGKVNQTMGTVSVSFGKWVAPAGYENEWWYDAANIVGGMIRMPREVLPGTLRYNAVVLTSLPLDPGLLGLDPVRLPMDGRVPVYRPGDIVVLHHTQTSALVNPVTPGSTYGLGRADLASVSLAGSNGVPVLDAEWSASLATGAVTIAANALLAGITQPLIATHRIEQMNLATDVQINGEIGFSAPLIRAFPSGSLLSSALPYGDLVARVASVFDQATWSGVWSDVLIGSQATAQYNDIAFPVEVLNDGAVTERWRISFTSATAFAVIGENAGQIATGTTAADVQVSNPLTAKPYFTLRAAGWGAGWATGNQLRFNTVGANAPIWIARTVLGGATLSGDAMTIEVRGDTD